MWVLLDGASKHRVAIDRLVQLRVFIETVDRYIFVCSPNLTGILKLLLLHGSKFVDRLVQSLDMNILLICKNVFYIYVIQGLKFVLCFYPDGKCKFC